MWACIDVQPQDLLVGARQTFRHYKRIPYRKIDEVWLSYDNDGPSVCPKHFPKWNHKCFQNCQLWYTNFDQEN